MNAMDATSRSRDERSTDTTDERLKRLSGDSASAGLRLDHRRPEGPCSGIGAVSFAIEGALHQRLADLTKAQPLLELAVIVAALDVCLWRYSDAPSIVVGCAPLRTDGRPAAADEIAVAVTSVEGRMSFRQHLLEVRNELREAFAQPQSYSSLLDDLGMARPQNRCGLFNVAVAYGELCREMPDTGTDVVLNFSREAGRITGIAAFRTELHEPESIERFCRHLLNVLRWGLEDSSGLVSQADMLTGEEKQSLLVDWNRTAAEFPRDQAVHQLFEAQADRYPGRTALVFGSERLTYRQLDERANQLAHYLQRLGVTSGTLVGLCLNRSLELVVSVLAVLKAGGAYVPLDPAYPKERLAAMLKDVEMKALVTQERLLPRIPEHRARVVCFERHGEMIGREPTARPPVRSGPEDLCYVIFTSGSTGRAKAAAVHHRGWTNLVHWFVREFSISPADRTLVMSSFSFDITQRAMAMPLTSGGELHLVASDGYEPDLILQTVREQGITLVNCAPSTFYPLIEPPTGNPASLASLRCLFLGGEAIAASRLAAWASSESCRTEIVNVYGAAECSDVSTFYRLRDFARYKESSVPIGRPIHNSQIYVLDEDLRLLPVGVRGELCIAGEGVGKGYLNDKVLTADKFVDNPFAAVPGSRLYRTGDLARYLPNGDLEFAGRLDHQVKIRGQRIELGEIETALRRHAAVKEAVVLDWQDSSGDRRLIAYVVPQPQAAASRALPDDLRTACLAQLPAYMVPNAFALLDRIPLSPNGKIDRGALPAPEAVSAESSASAADSRTPTEQALATFFSEVLNRPDVALDANFFHLGGHSLLATQVISRITEAFQVRLQAIEFLAQPTVQALAKYIDGKAARSTANGVQAS